MDKIKREQEKRARQQASDYLKFVRRVKYMADAYTDEVVYLKSRIQMLKEAVSDDDETLTNMLDAYNERCEKLDKLCDEYRKVLLLADRLIASLSSHAFSPYVIYEHYIHNKQWRELCAELDVTYSFMTSNVRPDSLLELHEKLCQLNAAQSN